jgi:hypothetical protein
VKGESSAEMAADRFLAITVIGALSAKLVPLNDGSIGEDWLAVSVLITGGGRPIIGDTDRALPIDAGGSGDDSRRQLSNMRLNAVSRSDIEPKKCSCPDFMVIMIPVGNTKAVFCFSTLAVSSKGIIS